MPAESVVKKVIWPENVPVEEEVIINAGIAGKRVTRLLIVQSQKFAEDVVSQVT